MIGRKPAQDENVGDHKVVIGFVPLLWWSPHCDVAHKAPINLSCKYVIKPRLPLSRVYWLERVQFSAIELSEESVQESELAVCCVEE